MKINHMQQLRDKVTNISAPVMEKDRVLHTKDHSVMEKTMAMLLDLEKEIDQQTYQLETRKTEALHLFEQMNAEDGRILACYFLEGKSTTDVGKTLFLSRRHVQRRLKEALHEFQLILSKLPDVE